MPHRVYVIRLSEEVLQVRRFREANPQHVSGKPCVYVGMTGLSPDERFRCHKRGHKSSRLVRRFGRYVMRRQFSRLDPMDFEEAQRQERRLADRLRRKGFAVWQR